MANTLDSALANTTVAALAAQLQARLAPVAGLTRPSFAGSSQTGSSVLSLVAPAVTAGPTVQENPASLESGDATAAGVVLTATHITASCHVTAPQRGQGVSLDWLMPVAIDKLAAAVFAKFNAQIVGATFATGVTVAPASFTVASIGTLLEALPAMPRALYLKGVPLAAVGASLKLNSDGQWTFPGLENGVHEIASASAGFCGWISTQSAFASSFALPTIVSSKDVQAVKLPLPQLGIEVLASRWFNRSTRAEWFACETILACAPANTAGLKLVATA